MRTRWAATAGTGFVVLALGLAAGCASAPPARTLGPGELKTVVGTWRGTFPVNVPTVASGAPHSLTIREDGTFTETIGSRASGGTVRIADGKIVWEGSETAGSATLHQGDGQRVLIGDGRVHSGPLAAYAPSYAVSLRPAP